MGSSSSVLQNNRRETFFHQSPALSPSSIAFFISGFEKLERETASIKLLVSVRETEKDYTEKLFDMTTMILESVESFMSAELPNKVLHSVALPSAGNEVTASYGFNYYR
jgi:hypothetical protein